jgi:hypothetical protein
MQRNATLTGPGMALSPAAQRRTVRPSTSSCLPASTCDQPSAAIAAANSSGCTAEAAIFAQNQAARRQRRRNGLAGVVGAERGGQRAVRHERRQALRAIWADGDKAERIGGKIGGDGCVAHAYLVGPLALAVNHKNEVQHGMH